MKHLCLDPGDTTGWSTWDESDAWTQLDGGQAGAYSVAAGLGMALGIHHARHLPEGQTLAEAFGGVEAVIMEDWSLYEDKNNPGHTILPLWDKCMTARYIGAVEFICREAGIPCVEQAALIKTEALNQAAEELFARPLHENRHQNDSIMHWVFYAGRKGYLTPAGP